MFVKDEKTRGETDVVGYIGQGMLVEGRLSFDSTVRIDGAFKGEICARGTLVVGEGAQIEAEVKVDTVIVTGTVQGVIEAAKRVELQAPGKIIGEVRTPNLIIGDGGVLEGNCTMTKREGSKPEASVSFEEGKAAH